MAKYDVFISYRRSDVVTARALEKLLTAFGRAVFLDVKCIPAGTPWESAIDAALRTSQTMIVLWSSNAAASDFMKLEWQRVSDACSIIPLRLDQTPLPGPLAHREAIELPVHERLIARTTELVRQGMSQRDATQKMAQELEQQGIALTPEQQQAVTEYAGTIHKTNWLAGALLLLLWLWRRGIAALFGTPAAAGIMVLLAAAGVLYVSSVPPTVHAICEDGPSCAPAIRPEPVAPVEQRPPPTAGGRELEEIRAALVALQQSHAKLLTQLADVPRSAPEPERTPSMTNALIERRVFVDGRQPQARLSCTVPELDLSGELTEEVVRERVRVALDRAGLKSELRVLPGPGGYWSVIEQSPRAGQQVRCGASVVVQIRSQLG
jgi:hypothetical protein